jgi:hypothetical protein
MSTLRHHKEQAVSFVLACTVLSASFPARGTTEAEAVEELVAVLGVTLPCPRYAVAWLAVPPNRIEHRCAASPEKVALVRQEVPKDRVSFAIDMQLARTRYAAVYRLRGTPTPAVVLAQFLAGVAALASTEVKIGPHGSPLIIYSESSAPLPQPVSLVGGPRPLEAKKAIVFRQQE